MILFSSFMIISLLFFRWYQRKKETEKCIELMNEYTLPTYLFNVKKAPIYETPYAW